MKTIEQVNDKAIRQLSKIIFRRAFALGWFADGDKSKVSKYYDMMVNDLQDAAVTDEVKELIDILSN